MTITDDDKTASSSERAPRGRSRSRRAAPTGAPAARFEPGRVAEARHRNPTWIVAGVLLVLLCALGGVLLFTSNDDRAGVLVAARDLEPGRAITQADLRIERVAIDGAVSSISATGAADLVGQHTVGRIPAGAMLSPAMFASSVPLGADEMVVGAALDPGEAPLSQLEVGAEVVLIRIGTPAAAGEPGESRDVAASRVEANTLGTGTVWAVEPIATGQLWVSVRVTSDVGMAASVASAEDVLRVALVGAGE